MVAVLDGFDRTLDVGIPIIKNLTQEAQAYGDPNVIQGLHSDEDKPADAAAANLAGNGLLDRDSDKTQ